MMEAIPLQEFLRESREFQIQTTDSLAQLTVHAENTVKRLDTLNGSVARHEKEIAELKSSRDSAVAVAAARLRAADKLQSWVQPVLMAIAGAILALVLQNGPALLGHADQPGIARPASGGK